MPNPYVDSFLESSLNDPINRNIKNLRVGPDGSYNVSLYDGNQSPKNAGAAQARVPQIESSAMQTQQAPTAPVGKGINDILSNPAVISGLAAFGKAFSKNDPNSAGTILGDFAQENAKKLAYKEYMDSLTNSNAPPARPGAISTLSPQEQTAAQQFALAQKQERTQSELAGARIENLDADTQRLRNLPTPQEQFEYEAKLKLLGKDRVRPRSETQNIKTKPDGSTAPPGFLYKMQFDENTGEYTKFAGLVPDPSYDKDKGKGGDKDPRPNASIRNQINEATTAIMAPVIKDAISRKLKTDNYEEINKFYNSLKDQTTGAIDTGRLRLFLTPEENSQFANTFKRFEDHYLKGGTISETETEIFDRVLREGGAGTSLVSPPTATGKKQKLDF